MPNPPPATTELLSGFNVVFLDEELELTTPTGAAIVRYYVKSQARSPSGSSATGAGSAPTRRRGRMSCASSSVRSDGRPAVDEEVWVMEADMDDMETEYMGAVADRIRERGRPRRALLPRPDEKGEVGHTPLDPCPGIPHRCPDGSGLPGDVHLRPAAQAGVPDGPCEDEEVRQTSFGPVRVKTGYDRSGRLREDPHRVRRGEDGSPTSGACRTASLLDALKKEL